MALTDVKQINLGLSKIASSRIKQINPPTTALEQFMALGYPEWKRQELAKRRWVCATEEAYALTLNATLTGVARPYKYLIPNDCLRPLRDDDTEWQQRGRFIYSAQATLKIDYLKNIDPSDFDPLLADVVACRIAMESAEYVTQSNTKKADAAAMYRESVTVAAKANAFVRGPELIGDRDETFSWIIARDGEFV